MFKTIRIGILLFILFFVAFGNWLTQSRSTDWNNSLWIKIYPINGDGSDAAASYIGRLEVGEFEGIERFLERETERYSRKVQRPVRVELGEAIGEHPPDLPVEPNALSVMWWSLKMRWWTGSVTDAQDRIEPDVRVFVRYYDPEAPFRLENSVGLQKGMVGIVNAYASRRHRGTNNLVIAHEFLHTLGATDKYSPDTGHPIPPDGIAEPGRQPLYPQRLAEIMGGRIALAEDDSVIPQSLEFAIIGPRTAAEIRLID